MAMLERMIEQRLIYACKKHKIKTIKGDAKNNKGFPDRIIFNHYLHAILYVEIKNDSYYKQTPLQKEWEMIIKNSGGHFFLVNGIDEMNDFINKYIRGNV